MGFVANPDAGRHEIFEQVWALAGGALEQSPARLWVVKLHVLGADDALAYSNRLPPSRRRPLLNPHLCL